MRKLFLICSFLLVSLVSGARVTIPDSLLTIQKAYYYSIACPDTSLAIIATMRERQMAPGWRLDMVEGDIYYNMRRYLMALKYYNKVDGQEAIKDSTSLQLFLLKWQMDCYDALLADEELVPAILRLRKKAERCGDKAYEGMSYFTSGKWHHIHRQQELGYRYCLDAVEMVKASDFAGKHAVLCGFYGELVKMYARDGRYDEAVRISQQQEAEAKYPWPIPILYATGSALRHTFAIRASMLAKAGQMTEADVAYAQWKQSAGGNVIDDRDIFDYLRLSGHLDEALRVMMDYRNFIYTNGDSISMRMLAVLNAEALLHLEVGETEKAFHHGTEIARISDSLFIRKSGERMQTGHELFQEQVSSNRKTLWLSVLIIGLVAVLLVGLLILYYTRKIHHRNKVLARALNGLDAYRRAVMSGQPLTSPEVVAAIEDLSTYSAESDLGDDQTEEPDDEDRRLFVEMDTQVTRDKLFLNPRFGRDELTRLIGVDKNRFGKMMSKYSDASNTSVYINTKRVEYGAQLLLEHPEYTIATIATECGMSNTVTFNRTFKFIYGMTPSEYREKVKPLISTAE